MRKIILASGSPRRKEILERAGLKFTVDPSSFEEDMTQKLSPRELVEQLALGKAASVALRHKNAIVIGADTVVAIIETMKLMNSVHAGTSGRVARICLENGEFAPLGATLLLIEPGSRALSDPDS